ncbi:cadmium-translocating P-type ATPase [Elizabethkingia argentiflava]|uniref:P-type Zn(2+) transporter n=1 Tax=Elizabethkingia argenteiflava TaxID=2681556 RepID=A0A845PTS0_9FLAO|nr:heavy metal translocating P-type ATPase [Elizabethkingia argenteiflava]NAW51632.1 cadmium-translocating P-type ATPase [Elizabethkingia argenteiflava]
MSTLHQCCSNLPHQKDDHEHAPLPQTKLQLFSRAIISFVILVTGLTLDHYIHPPWFHGNVRLITYIIAYIPVGFPVLKDAVTSIRYNDLFSEFFLMSIASIGAFAIGEYPEAVAVMLFYSVGEILQDMAVQKSKSNIRELLDQRPDEISILENNIPKTIKAKSAKIGQIIQLKPGEKLSLDGTLYSEKASFNTAALTGESLPQTKRKGDVVFAGMINLQSFSQVLILKEYQDSKLSKILELVQNAASQKAPTELFIRKFAKVYTPLVVVFAAGLCWLPYFFVQNYEFKDWLYRSLIFLVISCPCALVISIPLGYFGGIGAASKNGILVKGSNFLDRLATAQHVVMDKTGTLTQGVFKVQEARIENIFNTEEILKYLNLLESHSSHPIANAIHEYVGPIDRSIVIKDMEEIPGYGLKCNIAGQDFIAGNFRLLDQLDIVYPEEYTRFSTTLIALAYGGKFAGYLSISDEIKADAAQAISALKKMNLHTTMLSGDKTAVVKEVAQKVGIENAFGDLLPEGKVEKIKNLTSSNESIIFVGDGVNDAPVIALSDVGIAMGTLGSDATIETADVVIQEDLPSKIPIAIKIGKTTRHIVRQNMLLAFGVKALVLILGAGGMANMWEAVFADVGVALLAILNAVRIQKMTFSNS